MAVKILVQTKRRVYNISTSQYAMQRKIRLSICDGHLPLVGQVGPWRRYECRGSLTPVERIVSVRSKILRALFACTRQKPKLRSKGCIIVVWPARIHHRLVDHCSSRRILLSIGIPTRMSLVYRIKEQFLQPAARNKNVRKII